MDTNPRIDIKGWLSVHLWDLLYIWTYIKQSMVYAILKLIYNENQII